MPSRTQAEQISKNRKKILATTYKPSRESLHSKNLSFNVPWPKRINLQFLRVRIDLALMGRRKGRGKKSVCKVLDIVGHQKGLSIHYIREFHKLDIQ